MAIACAVLVLAITTLSAFIRLSRTGLGCEPWPQCYEQQLRGASEGTLAPVTGLVATARVAHRITAVTALLLIIAMLMMTLNTVPVRWHEGRMVLGLLALALFLAILGRWTADARVPAVVLGNLLAGLAMFGLSCRLVQATSSHPAGGPIAARWVWFAVGLLLVQIALGGLMSARHTGLSCPQLTACDPTAGSWQALNPWHEPDVDGPGAAGAAGALLHFLHRAGSLAIALVLVPLGVTGWRRGRRAGALMLVLLALQLLAGILLVASALPLSLALVHNVLAAGLLAALLSLLPQRTAMSARRGAGAQEKRSGSPVGPSAR